MSNMCKMIIVQSEADPENSHQEQSFLNDSINDQTGLFTKIKFITKKNLCMYVYMYV